LHADQTITGTFKYLGNSTINRLWIHSSTPGTARTITAAAIDASSNFTDFSDITGAGAAAPFATGTSLGNALGNTNITTTSPVTRYKVGGTGNYSSTGIWSTTSGGGSGASVPLCHDTIVFDSNSFSAGGQTLTLDLPRVPGLDFTNVTNSPAVSISAATITFGSVTLKSGMTQSGSSTLDFASRGSVTLTTNGVSMATVPNMQYCIGGTLTLGSAVTVTGTSQFQHTYGTLSLDGYNLTIAGRYSQSSGVTLTFGSGTFENNTTNASPYVGSSGATINAGTGTLKFSGNSGSAQTIQGLSNKSYPTLWIAQTGAGTLDISHTGMTASQLTVDAGRTVRFVAGQTFTAASYSFGSGCTITSITGATHTLVKSGGGTVSAPSATVSWSIASPASTFYAPGGTDGGNNTNWTFAAPWVLGGYVGGFAYSEAGEIVGVADTGQDRVFIGGFAATQQGYLIYTTNTSLIATRIGGLAVSANGALVVEDGGTPDVYIGGLGVKSNGVVCVEL
jgi:hypothetical protein